MSTATAAAPSEQGLQRQGTQAVAKPTANDVRDLLMRAEAQLALALPKHVPVSYFIRVAITVVQRTPKLLECDRTSLLGAMFQAAQLGLSLDPSLGQAYLVPFRNNKKNRIEVQFIPGYRGIVDLVRRSGQLSTIDADVVFEKDTFRHVRGPSPVFEHVPSDEANPGKPIKVYAWARLKDGGVQMKVMTVAEVERIRKRSKSAGDGPWVTDWEWMAKKTAIKQLCKLLPVSTETQRAIGLDDRNELNLPQDLSLQLPEGLADPNETPTPDDVDPETGEVIEMPQRASAQAPSQPSTAATVDAPRTPEPAAAAPSPAAIPPGADRIVDVRKRESQTQKGKFYWLAECASKRAVSTWDVSIGEALERFHKSGDLVDLVTEQPDRNGWRNVTSIEAFSMDPLEPGSEG